MPSGLQVLRRARGYAPLPIALAVAGPTMLAVGGHLKNTVALALGSQPMQVVLSPHVGDLDSVLSVEVFGRAIDDLVDFFAVTPEVVACDLHPDYASTRHAEQLAAAWRAAAGARAASSRPRGRLHGRAPPGRARCWGLPGTAPATAATARSGAARSLVCEGRAPPRWPICGPSPCPAAIGRCAQPRRSALGLLYRNCPAEAGRRAPPPGSRPAELTTLLSCSGAAREHAADQQHGPAVRRRGGAVRPAAGDQLRGPSGHGAGICRRRGTDGGLSACR